jgi:hypothetical protein
VNAERRLLQFLIALAGLVPVTAGLLGALSGGAFFSLWGAAAAQSHGAYLSGLLLGIGLASWSCVPHVEHKRGRLFLVTFIVVAGGMFRAIALFRLGAGNPVVWFALVMELAVTPALFLWQCRIAALFASLKGFSFPRAMPMFQPRSRDKDLWH